MNQPELGTVPPIVHEVLRSPGEPLDPATRAFFEPIFGHDFSKVRVHTDVKATESARAVNAKAYTVGRDVVFGARRYVPGTTGGKKLIAHELAHVVHQQEAFDKSPMLKDTLEKQADHAENSVACRQPVSIASAGIFGIQRKSDNNDEKETECVATTPPKVVAGEPPTSTIAGIGELSPAGQSFSITAQAAPVLSEEKSGILGLTAEKLQLAMEALESLLESAALKGKEQMKKEGELPSVAPKKEKTWMSFDVPIDESLLESKDLERELTIRFFQVAFYRIRQDPYYTFIDRWLDGVMAGRVYDRLEWKVWIPEEKIRTEIADRIAKGIRVIPYRSDSLPIAVQAYYQIRYEDARRLQQALEELHKVHYAEDALLSFYIAHYNGLVSVLNGILDLPVAPYNLIQTLRGKKEEGVHFLGRIPTLNYVGEYGQKYGHTMETGVVLGLFLIPGGGLASGRAALGEATEAGLPWLSRIVSGVRIGGIPAGATLLKITSIMFKGGALSYVLMSAHDLEVAIAELKTGVYIMPDGNTRPMTEDDAAAVIERILVNALVVRGALKIAPQAKGEVAPPEVPPEIALPKAPLETVPPKAPPTEAVPPVIPQPEPVSPVAPPEKAPPEVPKVPVKKLPAQITKPVKPEPIPVKPSAYEEDILSQPGISETRTPGSRPPPRKTVIGNFAHTYAEDLPNMLEDSGMIKLKSGLKREYEIPHPDYPPGRRPRIDRLDLEGEEIIEIKPKHLEDVGKVEARQYAEWMDKYEKLPLGRKWKYRVVTYDMDMVEKFMESIGYLEP